MPNHPEDLAVAFAPSGPVAHVGTLAGLRAHLGNALWRCDVWRADGTRLRVVDAQGSPRMLAMSDPAEPDAVLARLAGILDTLRESAPTYHMSPSEIPAADGSLIEVLTALDEAVDLATITADPDPGEPGNEHRVPGANWHNLAHTLGLT